MKNLKRILVSAFCLIVLTGCFARTGSFRGIRVAEEGKVEFTPYVGNTDIVGMKIAFGIFERSEIDLGLFATGLGIQVAAAGVDIGGKYLILDEKTSDDPMSLAIGSRANVSFFPGGSALVRGESLSLDLEFIGGKTFGDYTEDNLPGNTYLGLGLRFLPLLFDRYSAFDVYLIPQGRMFIGGEIPINTKLIVTPEISSVITFPPLIPAGSFFISPSAGIGFTFR